LTDRKIYGIIKKCVLKGVGRTSKALANDQRERKMNKLKYIAVAGILAGAIGAWPDTAMGGVLSANYVDVDCVAAQAMHCFKNCSGDGKMRPIADATSSAAIRKAAASNVALSCGIDNACAKSANCVVRK
jgi:hypothetical protein